MTLKIRRVLIKNQAFLGVPLKVVPETAGFGHAAVPIVATCHDHCVARRAGKVADNRYPLDQLRGKKRRCEHDNRVGITIYHLQCQPIACVLLRLDGGGEFGQRVKHQQHRGNVAVSLVYQRPASSKLPLHARDLVLQRLELRCAGKPWFCSRRRSRMRAARQIADLGFDRIDFAFKFFDIVKLFQRFASLVKDGLLAELKRSPLKTLGGFSIDGSFTRDTQGKPAYVD